MTAAAAGSQMMWDYFIHPSTHSQEEERTTYHIAPKLRRRHSRKVRCPSIILAATDDSYSAELACIWVGICLI